MRSNEAVSLSIHYVQRNDRERLHEILVNAGVFNTDEINCAMELFDVYILKGMNPNEYIFRGAFCDQQLRAFLCFGKATLSDCLYDLYWIVTDPLYQQSGLAITLMEDVDQCMRGLGARKILAETSSKPIYEKAHRLYSKCGYRRAALIRDYYAVGDDLVIYEKEYH